MLEAWPAGTVLTHSSGHHWKLGSLQTPDDQGIFYEGALYTHGRCWAGRGHLRARARGGGPLSENEDESQVQLQTRLSAAN